MLLLEEVSVTTEMLEERRLLLVPILRKETWDSGRTGAPVGRGGTKVATAHDSGLIGVCWSDGVGTLEVIVFSLGVDICVGDSQIVQPSRKCDTAGRSCDSQRSFFLDL